MSMSCLSVRQISVDGLLCRFHSLRCLGTVETADQDVGGERFYKAEIFLQQRFRPGRRDQPLGNKKLRVAVVKTDDMVMRGFFDQEDTSQRVGMGVDNAGSTAPGQTMYHGTPVFHGQQIQVAIDQRNMAAFLPETGVCGFTGAGMSREEPCPVPVKQGSGMQDNHVVQLRKV